VAHRREEGALRTVGLLGGQARLLQLTHVGVDRQQAGQLPVKADRHGLYLDVDERAVPASPPRDELRLRPVRDAPAEGERFLPHLVVRHHVVDQPAHCLVAGPAEQPLRCRVPGLNPGFRVQCDDGDRAGAQQCFDVLALPACGRV
jgi:hypothetical protein